MEDIAIITSFIVSINFCVWCIFIYSQTFPRLTIVTSAVDQLGHDLNGVATFAQPGLGCFGERYYHMTSEL